MPKKVYKCKVSGKTIPKERVEALKSLGIPESEWTCVEHSLAKPKKGIFLGESGTSQLLMVNKVYNDTVRSIFRGSKAEKQEDEDNDSGESYDTKEINYYNSAEEEVDNEDNIKIIKRQE